MKFGTPAEPSHEGSSFDKKKKRRRREKKPLPERMDAFERIIQLCSVRDRSVKELEDRLAKDGYASESIAESIGRACGCGLVDDKRFMDAFIRGRLSLGKGVSGIERDLLKHGIELESIEGWQESYAINDESEFERALDYLRGHPTRAKDRWSSAYRKLASRGFSLNIAKKATQAWLEECEQSEAF
ncbi:MAG: regulatory protein RecX [Eggerthellaceae bacterium]|nr:regulatory protein RecX [Eggerthellaceae bacterium]